MADVYDIAADIGKEFEILIDSHGPEHVTHLMQKVISALEHLERLSSECENENQLVDTLRTTITRLELEDNKRSEERQRHDRELEQIEEHYKQETRDLLSTVKRLQDENRKLASSLAAANERDSAFSEDESYFEIDLVNKLQGVIEKQRGQIKKLDQSILDYKAENDELKCQNDKLNACTRDLRRRLRSGQSQIHLLVDERADLTAKAHDLQREIQMLTRKLGTAAKECEDLHSGQYEKEVELKGKVIYDVDDPNRPRFSLPELRDILQERNALKARVSDLEDELAVFRPRPPVQMSPSSGRLLLSTSAAHEVAQVCKCSYHSGKIDGDEDHEEDEPVECQEIIEEVNPVDLPVHGPLPEDPDDAPWRKNESGIRKLFRRLFGVAYADDIGADVIEDRPSSRSIRKSLSKLSFFLPQE